MTTNTQIYLLGLTVENRGNGWKVYIGSTNTVRFECPGCSQEEAYDLRQHYVDGIKAKFTPASIAIEEARDVVRNRTADLIAQINAETGAFVHRWDRNGLVAFFIDTGDGRMIEGEHETEEWALENLLQNVRSFVPSFAVAAE